MKDLSIYDSNNLSADWTINKMSVIACSRKQQKTSYISRLGVFLSNSLSITGPSSNTIYKEVRAVRAMLPSTKPLRESYTKTGEFRCGKGAIGLSEMLIGIQVDKMFYRLNDRCPTYGPGLT